jgi:hypothetical protein
MTEVKYTSEAGHWYTLDGDPAYTIMGKNGQERNTTLRDARKLNLVPSVTTIIRVASAPGLERWKQEQVLLAALTLPRQEGEAESDWINRIMEDSKETGRKAADRGTAIHAAIQQHYDGQTYEIEFEPYVRATTAALASHFNDWAWVAEASFADSMGFGGKCDLHIPESEHCKGFVVDIKTKDFGPDDKIAGFDEQLMQLAAYRMGLQAFQARCANVFVSRSHPGEVRVVEWSAEDLTKGWLMFKTLLDFWQVKNAYKPEV